MSARPFIYRGVKAISAAAGINRNQFSYYVRELGLPVWRYEKSTVWMALPEDLVEWIKKIRDENLKK
jgi:hypothetical protein